MGVGELNPKRELKKQVADRVQSWAEFKGIRPVPNVSKLLA